MHKDKDRRRNRVDLVRRQLDMRGVGMLVVMEVVEHMTIAQGAWEVHGTVVEETERVGMEIDRSSPLPRHGLLMRTSSWEEVMAVEGEGQETGCQVDLRQEGGLVEGEEGYLADPEECDDR